MQRIFRVITVLVGFVAASTTFGQRRSADSIADEFTSPFLVDVVPESTDEDTTFIQTAGHTTCAGDCGARYTGTCEPTCAADPVLCTDSCGQCGCNQPGCSTCQPCPDRWYISAAGAWQQRDTVHEVDDSETFIKFHNGFAANAALGMRYDLYRFELEASFMNNEVDMAGAGGLSSPSPGNVSIRAYMFNVYYDLPYQHGCWRPYVGAGIGTYQSEINGLVPEFFDQLGAPFAGSPVNATSDMPLAYQFRAGVTRPIGCRSEFYTGYRYFKGEELEFASAPFASFAPTFHPDGAEIHSIELGVRVNF